MTAPNRERFSTSRLTLMVDRFMNRFITIGGLVIIAAVMAIAVFIIIQVLPLFGGASVKPLPGRSEVDARASLPDGVKPLAIGLDEWAECPFVLGDDGRLRFYAKDAAVQDVNLAAGHTVTSAIYDPRRNRLALGTIDGAVIPVTVSYKAEFSAGKRTVVAQATAEPAIAMLPGAPVRSLALVDRGDERVVAAVVEERHQVMVLMVAIGGKPAKRVSVVGVPERVLMDERQESLVVLERSGAVQVLSGGGDWSLPQRQIFRPFADCEDPEITSAGFLFGDVSLVFANRSGLNRQFSLFRPQGSEVRSFGQTKEFPALSGGAAFSAISVRNKAFLIGGGNHVSLRYGTSASVRWDADLPFTPLLGAINAKYSCIALLGEDRRLRLMRLDDPHPEAGLAAFFAPVWYEGFAAPKYEWQSTGGSDDFEPKLSMVNLMFGTLKATLYSLLFAVPVALMAAIYTAEFMHPRFKSVVKPAVEVMASLPSVVIGFLAALWLAPLLESRVPSMLMVLLLVPAATVAIGFTWGRLSPSLRSRLPAGMEFLAMVPVLLVVAVGAWNLGPWVERQVFTVHAGDGLVIADFRRWWTAATGLAYEQRNSLVVGVMMGFAVIPIIFTIAEDSLTNVPPALRSASLALGASRWQTAIRVVVPTASAGIFSAMMIGLGRAIGETMIVVMATGNTGVIDLNIFNGMRTLSANIAVELPEAPHGGTLYRTLFLGALLLFVFTFIINTTAEILRARLREKYKTV